MSITWNPKYQLYQLKGKEHIYLFDFDFCQQVKKDLPYKDIPVKVADDWFDTLGSFRKKKIKKVEIVD